jgi:zinc protease
VVIVIGDMDPATARSDGHQAFRRLEGRGADAAGPDFGKPVAEGKPVAASIVEPAVPTMAMMAIVRPWTVFSDTVIFNQKRMIDLVAIRIINRRLESRARSGGTFVAAGRGPERRRALGQRHHRQRAAGRRGLGEPRCATCAA